MLFRGFPAQVSHLLSFVGPFPSLIQRPLAFMAQPRWYVLGGWSLRVQRLSKLAPCEGQH
jgi:hypothetical protein